MLIILKKDSTKQHLEKVAKRVEAVGLTPHIINGTYRTTINVLGDDSKVDPEDFAKLDGVQDVIAVMKPYQLVSREFKPENTTIQVGDVTIGPGHFAVIAGPCAVESEEQTVRIAKAVKKAGGNILRGGAFKPRTSPYAFQGLGLEGLKILQTAKKETGMPFITEALDLKSLEQVYEYADIIQIGARSMQNFALLKAVGKLDKPVMLKRGLSATIDEWLMSAEYIVSGGNDKVFFCERGVRSFDDRHTRNMLDLAAIPVLQGISHLPVSVDPSHATGRREKVAPMALASLAAGANAIMMDVHDRAEDALCDGPQALVFDEFAELVKKLRVLAKALDVKMG